MIHHAAGKAAEHLVCFDLTLRGYNAFLCGGDLPYDVCVDIGGRFVKVQVKSTLTLRAKANSYQFLVRGGNERRYKTTDFDIVACVALDTRQIAYFHYTGKEKAITISPSEKRYRGRNSFADLSFEKALSKIFRKKIVAFHNPLI